jgi:Transglutaminase-like superfamily
MQLTNLLKLPAQERWAAVEALACLCLARFLILVPFRLLAPLIGRQLQDRCESLAMLVENERFEAFVVRRAILRVAEKLPWQSNCLVRALAARMMLGRRRLPFVLQLGVRRRGEALSAHAWLRCGDIGVIGVESAQDYVAIVTFCL